MDNFEGIFRIDMDEIIERILHNHGSIWGIVDQFLADLVEREEINWMKVKVSSSKLFCCSLLLSVLDTASWRKYSRINMRVNLCTFP